MPYIRHKSLFSLQELYEMELKDRFRAIFSAGNIALVLRVVWFVKSRAMVLRLKSITKPWFIH
ncbi:hypothetical protein SAMN02799630_05921 [Paenibacillus sp. UNCCL117]|nr:hypothetical protein SAMN04488602_1362 [Paenibacillus sp. cl123]SFW69747.1 hypothetical protein SAMN02799630_05921 [Paenibacillus sp. UNCCL117]